MPIHYEQRGTIACPIDEVFEYVTAPDHEADWIPGVRAARPVSEDMGVGAVWTREIDRPIGTADVIVECTEYDPPTRFAYRTPSGMLGGRLKWAGEYTLTEEGPGTHLAVESLIQVRGWLRLVRPVVARIGRENAEETFVDLQSAIESARH